MKTIFKKALTGLVAGSALIGAIGATAADARPGRGGGYGYGYHGGGYGGYHHYRAGWGPGAAIGLGIAGLAVGAALASQPSYYDRGYYYDAPPPPPPPPGYYGYGYGYGAPRGYYYGY